MSITLTPDQQIHFDRLVSILTTNTFVLDKSVMGAGKTYVAIKLAQKLKYKLLVVCPKSTVGVWSRLASEHGVEVVMVSTYASLRGTVRSQPKHGFLDRYDDPKTHRTTFTPTSKWLDLVQNNVLIVLDEVQEVKNASEQGLACRTLCRSMMSQQTRSRICLLSGSMIDKEEQSINLMKIMGLIKQDKLNRGQTLLGAEDLIKACQKIDRLLTDKLVAESKRNVKGMCYDLFYQLIVPTYSSAMSAPFIEAKLDVKNAFYSSNEDLEKGVAMLKKATQMYKMSGIMSAMVEIEKSKVSIMVGEAKKILSTVKQSKVVCFVNYNTSIDSLRLELKEYQPLILSGKVSSAKKRQEIVDAFNTQPEVRLLIANLKVGGTGISLHDTEGSYPRYGLIFPNYSIQDLYQCPSRFHRIGAKSDSTVRFIYGDGKSSEEMSILDALARKSEVMGQVLSEQKLAGMKFPAEYERVYC